jgi:hypothetical protein
MLQASRNSSSVSRTVAVLSVLAMSTLGATSASAQEDDISAPPPLQWPTSVSAHATGQVPFQLGNSGLRHSIEEAADLSLCTMLMTDANMPIPTGAHFTYADCPPSIKAKIDAREGKVAWAEGARPTECGSNCLGGPFMLNTQNVDRPNSRYALAYGHLIFHVDIPGPFNRDVYYGLEIDVTCNVPAGTRDGTANVTAHVDGPWAEDPGILESIANFLVLPLDLSQRITDGINAGSGVSTNSGPSQGPCTSIGATHWPPAEFKFDAFLWDVPPPKRPSRTTIGDVTAVKPTVTLYFDRIIRNHTIESNPSPGPFTFTLYINGAPAHIPLNGTISLSPNGASHDQKYCKTLTMDGVDSLQILFVDSFGGAVWSQFTSAQNFGSGGAHKMTTGRRYLRPGLHPGDKPTTWVSREFELDYRVDYHGAPTSVAPVTMPSTLGLPSVPTTGVLAPPDQPPPGSSCIRI